MRPDLQELEITLGELKRLTGFEFRVKSKGAFVASKLDDPTSVSACFFGILPTLGLWCILANSSSSIHRDDNDWFIIISSIIFIVASISIGIYLLQPIKKDSHLIDGVNQHNKIIRSLDVLDQLEYVGNPIKLSEREKVLEALKINRQNLVRALETGRILRENPKFKPEKFNIDLSGLRALQATENATEYGRFLDEILQIGVNVQSEMIKLESNRQK
ncbi:hypothetical protein [Microcystis sp.]|jgi:hypothetical protein|uniref:hypothetical protein n=1 Tax=Microcystis sp. TaxID=1127 RepID=UPI003AF7455C